MDYSGTPGELRIGDWTVDPALNLLRLASREVRLEPRYMDLLIYLAQRPGAVVSSDQILREVWPEQVVGDHSVYQAVARLRKALGDEALNPRFIETVPKRGYRLIAEVSTTTPASDPTPPALSPEADSAVVPPPRRTRRRAVQFGVAILIVSLIGIAVRLVWPVKTDDGAVGKIPSVNVLPFTALSDTNDDRYIAEGFAIELADVLGKAPGVRILGPVTASVAANDHDPQRALRDVQADYVVSGNLRRAGERLRVATFIADGGDGHQLWSKIFEQDDRGVFDLQRQIATEIATSLDRRLANDTPAEGGPQAALPAFDYFLIGRYHRTRRSLSDLRTAADLFEQSLDVDPTFTKARTELATTYLLLSFYGDLRLDEAVASATPLLQKSLLESANVPQVLGAIGLSHYLQGAYGLAEDYLTQATNAMPNYAEGWMWRGLALRQQGKIDQALHAFARARALEPLFVTAVINHADALSWTGDNQRGTELLQTLSETVDDNPQVYRGLADLAVDRGDLSGAYRWSQRALALAPDSQISRAQAAMIYGYLAQPTEAAAINAQLAADSQISRAAQRYLDRLSAISTGLLAETLPMNPAGHAPELANVAEIDWRLNQARGGLASYLNGEFAQARTQLLRALDGREYPIERTDFDLFLCSTLEDAARRSADSDWTRWRERCDSGMTASLESGWDTIAIHYVEARLAVLDGNPERALPIINKLIDRGFRNRGLLAGDPVFEVLHGQNELTRAIKRIDGLIARDWQTVLKQR